MANKYVIISNSYSTNGTGTDFAPFTWDQFLADLSGGGLEGLVNNCDYYISGTRTLTSNTSITISANGDINFYSWSENSPAIIQTTNDIYFEQYCLNFGLYDLMIQAGMTGTSNNLFDDGYKSPSQDYGNIIIDNCYLKLGTNARFANLSSFKVRNSIIIATNLQGSCNSVGGMTAEFINTIFDISDFNATTANNVGDVLVDNCAFTSAITSFTQDTTTWSNIHSSWTRPTIFSSAVSAINIATNLKYIDSPFSLISATGETSYTNTWYNGTRDGIGALYFPTISGVAVSAISASAPLNNSLPFVLSGNNPFTIFSASSAVYDFDDTQTSSVGNNDVITHSFSANGTYSVGATIYSFNEWYTFDANSFNISIGSFSVNIRVFKRSQEILQQYSGQYDNFFAPAYPSGKIKFTSKNGIDTSNFKIYVYQASVPDTTITWSADAVLIERDHYGDSQKINASYVVDVSKGLSGILNNPELAWADLSLVEDGPLLNTNVYYYIDFVYFRDLTDFNNSIEVKLLDELTFIVSSDNSELKNYEWNFGNNTTGSNESETLSYVTEGKKTVGLSAYNINNPSFSSTDFLNILILATSNEYFVNINSAYDVCANNDGTSADPFNWSEFKGRVETSGDYLDVYRLSGSRILSGGTTSNRFLLNVDKTKNFTIRDWDVSSYGPWILISQDFSVSDENSIISAVGCTLKNGIIYNKPYSFQNFGGQIAIGTTYNMFIVYQGDYSHIIIDPYHNVLSDGEVSGVSAFTVWTTSSIISSTSSNYCGAPDWVYMNTYIDEDFRCSANPNSASSDCIDPWWNADARNYYYYTPVSAFDGFYGAVMYRDTVTKYLNVSPNSISGDFQLDWVIAFSATGTNTSIHMYLDNASTSANIYDYNYHNGALNFAGAVHPITAVPGHAMKLRLVRRGTSIGNTTAYYYHYTPTTCANYGDNIGSYQILTTATVNGPIILRVDGGDQGFGYGYFRFQSDSGLPYSPNIVTGLSASQPPSWTSAVSGSGGVSWLEENFDGLSINCFLSSGFKDDYRITTISGSTVAIRNLIATNNVYIDTNSQLTRLSNPLSGNFVFETSLVFSGGRVSGNSVAGEFNGIGIRDINGNSLFYISYHTYNPPYLYLSNDCSFSRGGFFPRLGMKMERQNGIISAFYNSGTGWEYAGIANYSSNVTLGVFSNGYGAFEYFKIAAQSGLSNNYNIITSSVSALSSVNVVSGTAETVITSAFANIVGSTIYLSGDGWKDNFNSTDYENQEIYELSLIDSVFVNFEKETSGDFSACSATISNNTFNNSIAIVQSGFSGSNVDDCQFNWNPPNDYPFTKSNDLYNKDITYIISNKKELRPFDGITYPPNPGLNFSAYPNYETGLFGYSRKDYRL